MAGRQALAEVAGVPDRPAVLPDRALLLLRELLPAPARQLLTCRWRAPCVIVWHWCSPRAPARTSQTATTTQPLDPFATTGPSSVASVAPARRRRRRRRSTSDSASTPTASPPGAAIDLSSARVVDCAGPHQQEVYAIVAQPGDAGAPYPGDDVLAAFADDSCLAAFTAVHGTRLPRVALRHRERHDRIEAAWDGVSVV